MFDKVAGVVVSADEAHHDDVTAGRNAVFIDVFEVFETASALSEVADEPAGQRENGDGHDRKNGSPCCERDFTDGEVEEVVNGKDRGDDGDEVDEGVETGVDVDAGERELSGPLVECAHDFVR